MLLKCSRYLFLFVCLFDCCFLWDRVASQNLNTFPLFEDGGRQRLLQTTEFEIAQYLFCQSPLKLAGSSLRIKLKASSGNFRAVHIPLGIQGLGTVVAACVQCRKWLRLYLCRAGLNAHSSRRIFH